MDNFNLQKYLASGKIHADNTTLTEAKKQGYDDREDESLGARKGAEKDKKQSMKDRRDDSYGKFGKRDAEKKGRNKINKENVVKENKLAQKLRDEATQPDSKVGAAIFNKYAKKIENADKEDYKKIIKSMESELISKHPNTFSGEDDIPGSFLSEDARTDAEEEGYKDGIKDEKEDAKKMKVSELKAKIKETILAELSLAEDGFQADQAGSTYHAGLYNEAEEDVDVDVDFEDEVNVDAEGDDIEIERPAVKAKVQVGLSPEETIIQDSLKAAMDAADAIGNDKLGDQIGNTITFFTREYVVGRN